MPDPNQSHRMRQLWFTCPNGRIQSAEAHLLERKVVASMHLQIFFGKKRYQSRCHSNRRGDTTSRGKLDGISGKQSEEASTAEDLKPYQL